MRCRVSLAAALLVTCVLVACDRREPAEGRTESAPVDSAGGRDSVVAAVPAAVRAESLPPAPAPLVPKPTHVRGLYVNRWMALGDLMWQLIDVAKRTEVNALVI